MHNIVVGVFVLHSLVVVVFRQEGQCQIAIVVILEIVHHAATYRLFLQFAFVGICEMCITLDWVWTKGGNAVAFAQADEVMRLVVVIGQFHHQTVVWMVGEVPYNCVVKYIVIAVVYNHFTGCQFLCTAALVIMGVDTLTQRIGDDRAALVVHRVAALVIDHGAVHQFLNIKVVNAVVDAFAR